MPRVLIVRGHQVTPWELRPWTRLPGRFDVRYLRTASNGWDDSGLGLPAVDVTALRDKLPAGRLADVAASVAGDRYLADADAEFAAADIVHAEELGFWFAADAARRRARGNFKLVQTVWETLPMLHAFRNRAARKHREAVLAHTDLFLATTERARTSLLLEGVEDERVAVCYPGVDTERFAAATRAPGQTPGEHVIVSPGRLVWEKGHQDALRAVALLHRGIVRPPAGEVVRPRLRIVGHGPEEQRLREHAAELGVADHVEIGGVPYDEMPRVFATASCLLLGSQASATAPFHPFDVPRAFWEEQFGMVFVEAMAAGLPVLTTSSGAIPEVLEGAGTLVPAGDYVGMAKALAAGPLAGAPGTRVTHPAALLERYSLDAMAQRLAAAYDGLTSARR